MNRTESRLRRPLAALWGLVLATAAAGCGSDPDQQFVLEHPDALHPVAGKVYFNGQPLHGAVVTFFPASPETPSANMVHDQSAAASQSYGRTGPDGTYEIDSPGPGVPVGEYQVTVSWKGPNATGPSANHLPDQLPPKYQDPATSGLKASVKPGDNLIPNFDLN